MSAMTVSHLGHDNREIKSWEAALEEMSIEAAAEDS